MFYVNAYFIKPLKLWVGVLEWGTKAPQPLHKFHPNVSPSLQPETTTGQQRKSTFSTTAAKLLTPITLSISVQLYQHNELVFNMRPLLFFLVAKFISEKTLQLKTWFSGKALTDIAFCNNCQICLCIAVDRLCQFYSWALTDIPVICLQQDWKSGDITRI